MRILLVSYVCIPGRGSEPGIGWNAVVAAAHADTRVTLVTRAEEGRDQLEKRLQQERLDVDVRYVRIRYWPNGWRSRVPGLPQLHHYLWQWHAFFACRRLVRSANFSVVHQVNFARCSTPVLVAFLGIPSVAGPTTGGENSPTALLRGTGWKSFAFEAMRLAVRELSRLGPFTRKSLRRTSVVLSSTEETRRWMVKAVPRDYPVKPSVALPMDEAEALGALGPPSHDRVRFLSVGRLVAWKGHHLALAAFAAADIHDAEYWIAGSGPSRDRLEAQTEALGIRDRVHFLGELDRRDVLAAYEQCHALVHPSLHDSGGWVCLEAMAAGRPVVALERGGPGTLVPRDCGWLVPVASRAEVISALSTALAEIARDPGLLTAKSQHAREHVLGTLTTDHHGERLRAAYMDALRGDKRLSAGVV